MKKNLKWYDILPLLLDAGCRRLALVGPNGTGKSTTAELSEPVKKSVRITLTPSTAVEDLLGFFHLIKGETIWVDGPAAEALRNGWRLVLDEIDHASPEVISLLYALLDDNPQVTLPSGEHLKAHDGYQVICTSNASVEVLDKGIQSRLEAILIADMPHPAAIQDLPKADQDLTNNYYKGIKSSTFAFSRPPAVRQVRTFSRLRAKLTESSLNIVIAEAVFGTAGKEFLSIRASVEAISE